MSHQSAKRTGRWLAAITLTLVTGFVPIASKASEGASSPATEAEPGSTAPQTAPQMAQQSVDAGEIVRRADAIRFPRESFETRITVTNYRDGRAGDMREYKVMSRGNENTIVLTESPASERGQALLMRGRDLWIFLPRVSQPVRLSLSQRLTGQVANGDLARANFAGDYAATLNGTETVDGVETYVLDLTAAGRGITYGKVRYWVAVADYHPVRAEFYAVSGRLLKTSRYENFQELAGSSRPTRLVIEDALKEGDYSVLEYTAMTLRNLPERMFTQQYLRRL